MAIGGLFALLAMCEVAVAANIAHKTRQVTQGLRRLQPQCERQGFVCSECDHDCNGAPCNEFDDGCGTCPGAWECPDTGCRVNCHGHGVCDVGAGVDLGRHSLHDRCVCDPGWVCADCSVNCSGHGQCNWEGDGCGACQGTWVCDDCSQDCHGHGVCNPARTGCACVDASDNFNFFDPATNCKSCLTGFKLSVAEGATLRCVHDTALLFHHTSLDFSPRVAGQPTAVTVAFTHSAPMYAGDFVEISLPGFTGRDRPAGTLGRLVHHAHNELATEQCSWTDADAKLTLVVGGELVAGHKERVRVDAKAGLELPLAGLTPREVAFRITGYTRMSPGNQDGAHGKPLVMGQPAPFEVFPAVRPAVQVAEAAGANATNTTADLGADKNDEDAVDDEPGGMETVAEAIGEMTFEDQGKSNSQSKEAAGATCSSKGLHLCSQQAAKREWAALVKKRNSEHSFYAWLDDEAGCIVAGTESTATTPTIFCGFTETNKYNALCCDERFV